MGETFIILIGIILTLIFTITFLKVLFCLFTVDDKNEKKFLNDIKQLDYFSLINIIPAALVIMLTAYLLLFEKDYEKTDTSGIALIIISTILMECLYLIIKKHKLKNINSNKEQENSEEGEELSIDQKISILKENKDEMCSYRKPYFKISNGEVYFKDIIENYIEFIETYIDNLILIKEHELKIDDKLMNFLEEKAFKNFIYIEKQVQKMNSSTKFKKDIFEMNEEMKQIKDILIEFINTKIENEESEELEEIKKYQY